MNFESDRNPKPVDSWLSPQFGRFIAELGESASERMVKRSIKKIPISEAVPITKAEPELYDWAKEESKETTISAPEHGPATESLPTEQNTAQSVHPSVYRPTDSVVDISVYRKV